MSASKSSTLKVAWQRRLPPFEWLHLTRVHSRRAAHEAAASLGEASTLDERPAALAWDDNAKWLEQCKSGGVVSWYDAGLRLTAAAAAEAAAPPAAAAPAGLLAALQKKR